MAKLKPDPKDNGRTSVQHPVKGDGDRMPSAWLARRTAAFQLATTTPPGKSDYYCRSKRETNR